MNYTVDCRIYGKRLFTLRIFYLGGSAIWQILATIAKMPVSGTHSIVGATLGFTLVARGMGGVNWKTLGMIGKSSEVMGGVNWKTLGMIGKS